MFVYKSVLYSYTYLYCTYLEVSCYKTQLVESSLPENNEPPEEKHRQETKHCAQYDWCTGPSEEKLWENHVFAIYSSPQDGGSQQSG